MELDQIRETLANTESEADRLSAYGALKMYLDEHPFDDEARELYTEHSVLRRDWSTELVSVSSSSES